MWSLLAAALGIAVTAVLVRHLGDAADREAEVYWALGVAALTPAWVVAFLGILQPGAEPAREVRLFFMASIGIAMAGVIVTNTLARRLGPPGGARRPYAGWLLGVAGLVPAWVLALAGHTWLRP